MFKKFLTRKDFKNQSLIISKKDQFLRKYLDQVSNISKTLQSYENNTTCNISKALHTRLESHNR
ncbi:hypothetical protein Tsubulata_006346 [Turnera subulata]|uniref:Uncharacterized protein n=1 Tax=Turnera subulata TaxID=218843 RepID=A0A9Q0G6I5_9ROSI|nr:hypothetical protein Tsubulata_006346 [Turnera subulata]